MMYMPPQSLTDDILPNHYEKARMVGGEYWVPIYIFKKKSLERKQCV